MTLIELHLENPAFKRIEQADDDGETRTVNSSAAETVDSDHQTGSGTSSRLAVLLAIAIVAAFLIRSRLRSPN